VEPELVDEVRRERHSAHAILALGWTYDASVHGTSNVQSPGSEVDVLPTKFCDLTDAKAGAGQEQNEEPMLVRDGGDERLEFRFGQGAHFVLLVGVGRLDDDADIRRWIDTNVSVLEHRGQHRLHGTERVLHAVPTEIPVDARLHVLLDVTRRDLGEAHPPEERNRVALECTRVLLAGRLPKASRGTAGVRPYPSLA
jgi:hypothetical protein